MSSLCQTHNWIIKKSSAHLRYHPEIIALVMLLMAIIAVILLNPILFAVNIGSYKVSIFSLLTPLIALGALSCVVIQRSSLKPDFLDLTVFAFLLFFLFRNVFGSEDAAVLKFVIYGASLYYLAAIMVQSRKMFNILVFAIVLVASIAIVYGFIEYAVQYNFLFPNHANLYPIKSFKSFHRIGSTLSQPILFGAFLVQVFPFILLLAYSQQLWRRSFALTAFIWAFAALLLTYAKGSWLTMTLIAATSFFYMMRSGIKKFVPILSVIAMCLTVVVIFWNQASNDVSVRIDGSVNSRIISWDGATHAIADNYFLGVGFRQGASVTNEYLDTVWNKNTSVDNTYLCHLIEDGVIGFSLWMLMLGTTIVYGIKASRFNLSQRFWALASLASVVGFAINSITFDTHLVWANIVFFWISAGIIRGVYELDNNIDNTAIPYMLDHTTRSGSVRTG